MASSAILRKAARAATGRALGRDLLNPYQTAPPPGTHNGPSHNVETGRKVHAQRLLLKHAWRGSKHITHGIMGNVDGARKDQANVIPQRCGAGMNLHGTNLSRRIWPTSEGDADGRPRTGNYSSSSPGRHSQFYRQLMFLRS